MLYIKLIILEILLSTYKLIYKNINVRSVIIIQKYKNNHDNLLPLLKFNPGLRRL